MLTQAQIAFDLLAIYPRTELARLSLWLLGYDIELRHVRTAYGKSVSDHRRATLDVGGKSPEENVGRLAEIAGRRWSKEKGAPPDVREAITDCALAFLEIFYGTGGEFAGEGLAERWRKASPLVGGTSDRATNPSDADLRMAADYLRTFASLTVQGEMVRSATNYELMRARRLLRFAIGCFRRFDQSADCRDDIKSVGGWSLIVLGRPVVPILVAVLRQQTLRQEVMYRLLNAAKRLQHELKHPARLLN